MRTILITILVLTLVAVGEYFLVRSQSPNLPQSYADRTLGFSIRYPAGYTPDAAYQYQEFGPGKEIGGVKFTIPATLAAGTNLGSDSYASVEALPKVASCSATPFLDDPGAIRRMISENGRIYSFASSTGAAAGNRYEEIVYALPETNPCLALRYFIHYGVLENYPPGAVREFDESALLKQFDAIRASLTLN
ncbi:hypothetical protein HY091_02260 [Candidatus Kaiserbacteria bacterium]|nr:hypothetical protein [Candidatus Kaiserbacteria bacterium]